MTSNGFRKDLLLTVGHGELDYSLYEAQQKKGFVEKLHDILSLPSALQVRPLSQMIRHLDSSCCTDISISKHGYTCYLSSSKLMFHNTSTCLAQNQVSIYYLPCQKSNFLILLALLKVQLSHTTCTAKNLISTHLKWVIGLPSIR